MSETTKPLKVGDRVIYLRKFWMGGMKMDVEEVPATISVVCDALHSGGKLYNLKSEDGTILAYNVSSDELKKKAGKEPTKPQSFDEWLENLSDKDHDKVRGIGDGGLVMAYSAGQASMSQAVALLAEIVTAVDAAKERGQHPATALELWEAIDGARELLKGERRRSDKNKSAQRTIHG